MSVTAKIEFKDGRVGYVAFAKPSDYFRYIYLHAYEIKIAQTDDIKKVEEKK